MGLCFDEDYYSGDIDSTSSSDSSGRERSYTEIYRDEYGNELGGRDVSGNIYDRNGNKVAFRYPGTHYWYDSYGRIHDDDEDDLNDYL